MPKKRVPKQLAIHETEETRSLSNVELQRLVLHEQLLAYRAMRAYYEGSLAGNVCYTLLPMGNSEESTTAPI
jgi:hypothetical protein